MSEQDKTVPSTQSPRKESLDELVFADPWLKKATKTTKLPDDAVFACAYDLHIVVDLIEEAAFFRRTETSDELWIAGGFDLPIVKDIVNGTATPNDLVGTDVFKIGRVFAVPKKGEKSSSCMTLLDRLFRAYVGFCSPQGFLAAGIISESAYNNLVKRIEQELEENSQKARENETEIIKVARELGLSPKPTGTGPTHWWAQCPARIGHLYIDAALNYWWCGWCQRNGSMEELRAFVKERKDGKQRGGRAQQYAPKNWDYDRLGRPDVVSMELEGVEKSDIMGFQIKESDANLLASVLSDLINEGKAEQAAVIARLLEDPECADPERWLLLGLQAAHAGDLDSAETRFKKALELGSRNPRLYYELSTVLALKGEDPQAVVWAEKTVEAAPDVVIGYFHLARLHAAKDRIDEARGVLQKVMDSEDFSEETKDEAGKKLGIIFMNAQRYMEAVPYLQKAALTEEKDADLWMHLGHCYSRAGNLEGALEAFRKAVAIDPSPYNLYGLGDCLLALDQNKDAITILEKAVRLQPNYVMANYDLGRAYYEENRYEEGVAVSKRALSDDPEMKYQRSNPGLGATTNLGLCLMKSGRGEEALTCFDKNIGLIVSSFFNKGLTLYQMDRPKEAAVWFRRVLEIKPNDTSALNLLGQALDADGKFSEAVSCLKKAITIDPEYALGYYDLGVILSRKKDGREKAMRCFKKAISLPLREPFPAYAIYSIACLHALADRKKEAFDSLEQALEKGYPNRKYIDEDKDLDCIRRDARFTEMMEKYFGK